MKISVIIPFYNLEHYVRPCLDSVCAVAASLKTDVPLEVVCVDDGSTDGTAQALDGASLESSADFAIRVLHKPNGGEGSARNAGLAVAMGDWIAFLDGDDIWLPNHLEVAQPLLEHHPEADMIALKYVPFDDGAPSPRPSAVPEARCFDVTRNIPGEILLDVGVYPTFFRRDFLKNLSFSDLPLGADRLFVAQCLARAKQVVKCDAVVHGYRIRAGSMARAVWNARKVMSQCDYAYGSLRVLADSEKTLGRAGHAYLASLWLSDVPNRALRLSGDERRIVASKWAGTLDDERAVVALHSFEIVRRVLCAVARRFPVLSLRLAWLFRKGGLS